MALIRPAHDRDFTAITRIYCHYVSHGVASFETEPPSSAEMRKRYETLVAREFPYLVAEDEPGLAGYAYAMPYRAREAYRYTVENSVYVDPAMTGRGIGRALLSGLIARCEERGFRQMIAIIGGDDSAASIGLHAALGFERAGVLRDVGFKAARWLDTVIMQRSLGDGAGTPPNDPPEE